MHQNPLRFAGVGLNYGAFQAGTFGDFSYVSTGVIDTYNYSNTHTYQVDSLAQPQFYTGDPIQPIDALDPDPDVMDYLN